MSVSLLAYLKKPHVQTSQNFLYMLPVAMAWSSCDGAYIIYFQFCGCCKKCFCIIRHMWCMARLMAKK